MKIYEVQHPTTKQIIEIESESEPTAEQLRAVISKIGGSLPATPEESEGFLEGMVMHPIRTAERYGRFLGEGAAQLGRAIVDPSIGFTGGDLTSGLKKSASQSEQLMNQARELTQRAKKETNPEEKKRLLNQARELTQSADAEMSGVRSLAESPTSYFVDPEKISDQGKIIGEGLKATAGAASYAIPAGAGLSGAVTSGAISGGLETIASFDESMNVGDVVAGTLTGGILGGGIYGGTKILKGTLKSAMSAVNNTVSTPRIKAEAASEAAEKLLRSTQEGMNQKKPGWLEKTYSSAFPFSRKGYAFERLQPQETAAVMIKDGVWGKPNTIMTKAGVVTGKHGIVTGIVDEAMDKAGKRIEIPEGFLRSSDYDGIYTQLEGKDFRGLGLRIAKVAGEAPTSSNASGLFKLQQQLEREAYDVVFSGVKEGRATEFAKLKIDVAKKLEQVLDREISKLGIAEELVDDPAIIALIHNEVSPQAARRFMETKGDLRLLRAFQKDYYRVGEMARLSTLEAPALGREYMGSLINRIPLVGKALQSAKDLVEPPMLTGGTVALDRLTGKIKMVSPGLPSLPSATSLSSRAVPGLVNQTQLPESPEDAAFSAEGFPLWK